MSSNSFSAILSFIVGINYLTNTLQNETKPYRYLASRHLTVLYLYLTEPCLTEPHHCSTIPNTTLPILRVIVPNFTFTKLNNTLCHSTEHYRYFTEQHATIPLLRFQNLKATIATITELTQSHQATMFKQK